MQVDFSLRGVRLEVKNNVRGVLLDLMRKGSTLLVSFPSLSTREGGERVCTADLSIC